MAREGRHELPVFCIDVDFKCMPEGNEKASCTAHDCVAAIRQVFALSRVEPRSFGAPFRPNFGGSSPFARQGVGQLAECRKPGSMKVVPLLAHFRRSLAPVKNETLCS